MYVWVPYKVKETLMTKLYMLMHTRVALAFYIFIGLDTFSFIRNICTYYITTYANILLMYNVSYLFICEKWKLFIFGKELCSCLRMDKKRKVKRWESIWQTKYVKVKALTFFGWWDYNWWLNFPECNSFLWYCQFITKDLKKEYFSFGIASVLCFMNSPFRHMRSTRDDDC